MVVIRHWSDMSKHSPLNKIRRMELSTPFYENLDEERYQQITISARKVGGQRGIFS